MQVVAAIEALRALRGALPAPVGLVPTMGALHRGHTAIVRRAHAECASIIVSIFVNPLQFGPNEDYTRYPRPAEADAALLAAEHADVLFQPSVQAMYPDQPVVVVDPGRLGAFFEGERRPGHFRGVATIVLKLLQITQPDRAYFGRKDAQQLAIIKRMVRDFDLSTTIIGCETVREPDGLALSSRNVYLDDAQRAAAPGLHRALQQVADALSRGQREIEPLLEPAARLLPPLRADYLGVVDPRDFAPLAQAPAGAQLLVLGAAFAGNTRLIDNIEVNTP
ncbi:MAG: pantoate--beta-alanine ligase [Candidatus Eremiobacteraeota bacterium]|nr:pantoate--beta-alanine ligase [Candidatus Eremiobacteraeota bacterium]